jgi:hypothetical protein
VEVAVLAELRIEEGPALGLGKLPVNEHSADRAVHSYLATFLHAVYEEVGLVAADHRLARHRHELSTP